MSRFLMRNLYSYLSSVACHSRVTLELVRKIKRYRELLLNSYDKGYVVTLTLYIVYFNFRVVEQP